uniref:DUF4378 domain-containing protein n=1 Tax=Leersia perrieri TaxID=77586 RepID=A0A0D9W8E4_9ORYZ
MVESAAPSMEKDVGRPRPPLLMLKEWLELESIAELSRDGFGCYPRRQLAADQLRGSGSGRGWNGAVIERVSAAVRAALFPPSARQGGGAALSKSLSRKLIRRGFWKKRKGEGEEEVNIRVESCSAAAVSGREDESSPAMSLSPRRRSWDGGHAGGGGRRSHEIQVVRLECETTCHLREELEQGERLSPVSVMDFLSQDEDDCGVEDCNGESEFDDGDDLIVSPTFQQSLANIRRASQQLLQKIRQFEQLAELDASDVDESTMAKEDGVCYMTNSDSMEDDVDVEEAFVQDLLDLLEASSPGSTRCFKKLLVDFFFDGLLPWKGERLDDPDRAKLLLETAKAWLDDQDFSSRLDAKAEIEEIERLVRWRCFKDYEQELVAVDLEGEIFWSLIAELVGDLG